MREKKHISSPFSPWNCFCSLGTWWNNILSPEYHLPPWADPHNIFPHPPPSNNSHLILPTNIMGSCSFRQLALLISRSCYPLKLVLSLFSCTALPYCITTTYISLGPFLFMEMSCEQNIRPSLYRLFLLLIVAKLSKNLLKWSANQKY